MHIFGRWDVVREECLDGAPVRTCDISIWGIPMRESLRTCYVGADGPEVVACVWEYLAG